MNGTSPRRGIFFIIALLAILAMGAVVYVFGKRSCTIPDDINQQSTTLGTDGFPMVPYCESELGEYIYKNATDICGDPTTNMPDGTSPLYCDYKNDYSWVYSSPGDTPGPAAHNCDLKDGKLPFPITYDGTNVTNNFEPAENYQRYKYVSAGGSGACRLVECSEGYKPWTDPQTNEQYCTPNDEGTKCDTTKYSQLPGTTKGKPYPDKDSLGNYVIAYEKDKPTTYCKFIKCRYGEEKGVCQPKTPAACDTNDFPNSKVVSRNTSSGKCEIQSCEDTNSTDNFEYKVNKKKTKCVKTCRTVGGKKYKLDSTTGDCIPDCTDLQTVYIEVFGMKEGEGAPQDLYEGFKAVYAPDLKRCVPSDRGGFWGNCGNDNNPTWSLSGDADKIQCIQTIYTDRAKFVKEASDGNTPGCVQCPPLHCKSNSVNQETFTKLCNAKEEEYCNFSATEKGGALQGCFNTLKDSLRTDYKFLDIEGDYMFVNGADRAVRGYPIVTVPKTKFVRYIRIHGSKNERVYMYGKRADGSQFAERDTIGTKHLSSMTIPEGGYLHGVTEGWGFVHNAYLHYDDIEDQACYNYDHNKDNEITKMECPSDAPAFQPPPPETDPCKMSKCPLERPMLYKERGNDTDTSKLYELTNWPHCLGAIKYELKNTSDIRTVGEAYDKVLSVKNNSC